MREDYERFKAEHKAAIHDLVVLEARAKVVRDMWKRMNAGFPQACAGGPRVLDEFSADETRVTRDLEAAEERVAAARDREEAARAARQAAWDAMRAAAG